MDIAEVNGRIELMAAMAVSLGLTKTGFSGDALKAARKFSRQGRPLTAAFYLARVPDFSPEEKTVLMQKALINEVGRLCLAGQLELADYVASINGPALETWRLN